jgi:hypothetical protein
VAQKFEELKERLSYVHHHLPSRPNLGSDISQDKAPATSQAVSSTCQTRTKSNKQQTLPAKPLKKNVNPQTELHKGPAGQPTHILHKSSISVQNVNQPNSIQVKIQQDNQPTT